MSRVVGKCIKAYSIARTVNLRLLRALRFGVAASVEHGGILRHLMCETVVDVGANRGQFALMARYCFPSAKIISFEPLPRPAEIFRRVFAHDEGVFLHEAAVGPVEEMRGMHISARDDSSSLLPISSLQSKIFPGTAEVSVYEVRVAPLDAFVALNEIVSPALLKLDVQGFEYEALSGCKTLLSQFDFVYCECSFVELYSGQKLAADVVEWLSQNGFRLKGIYNPAYDAGGVAIQADFLFQRY